ncbi:MAG: acetyl/propionyl/methylcrotonyl-CoA carboxylase subunit alpha [Alphaproteobacteria bacterium]|nr:acetyl/propionyl/methylcrotonyl-CoA carboxylase subunit alpha [Alphaproteobacteria bacterium]
MINMMNKNIKSILIANRGEIACRVIRTCKKLGIKTIAIYADTDANAQHVMLSDHAISLQGLTAQETYLNQDKIIQIAKDIKADAIHPGYGFLSENADFAEKVEQANIIFIGPKSITIRQMGDKAASKKLMASSHVPMLPGYEGDNQNDDFLLEQAQKIGFPLILKPSAGGGGKGMKIVHKVEDFLPQLQSGRREALSSFGDARIILERYLSNPRHIEVQVFGDSFGHVIHLFERECTLQRRYQKIIEEAPSVNLPFELREKICQTAVKAAESVNYLGAGTVEFLLDQDNHFYFMEMNTRLQVEHPVTEMITGLDLVAWQIWVAEDKPLQREQRPDMPLGHAMEARLYAEDPSQNFLPSTGTLSPLSFPDERVDIGVQEFDKISHYFDPMIGKLIVWGEDRGQAVKKLESALQQTIIGGVKTNIPFLRHLLTHPQIQAWNVDVTFIDRHLSELLPPVFEPKEMHWLSIALGIILSRQPSDQNSPWSICDNFRINMPKTETLKLQYNDIMQDIVINHLGDSFLMTLDQTYKIKGTLKDKKLSITINNNTFYVDFYIQNQIYILISEGQILSFKKPDSFLIDNDHSKDAGHTMAPMTGKVVDILVNIGDDVIKGKELVILEAMKMEHIIRAHNDGKIISIHYHVGDVVEEGVELMEIELPKAS